MQSERVVKAHYSTKTGASKSSIRYAVHRENERGEVQSRELFGRDTDRMDKEQAYQQMDEGRGPKDRYTYTLVLNPGEAEAKGIDLKEMTRQVMEKLEEKGLCQNWVAVEHRDQGSYAHVHVIATSSAKLNQADLSQMRQEQHASLERQTELTRDTFQTRELDAHLERHAERERAERSRQQGLEMDF